MKFHIIAAALLGGLMSAGAAGAATLTFDGTDTGYTVTDGRIVNGNCADAPCLALNKNETPTITADNGGTFSLSGFWFQLLGKGTVLTATTNLGSQTFGQPEYEHNQGYTLTNLGSIFSGIQYLKFSTNKGNVRIDDLVVSQPDIAPIPVPAAGFLLLGAMGALALRRRKAA